MRAFEVQRWLLPAPSVIVNELYVSRGILLDHAATTLTEVVLGFGLSTLAGILLAAAIASSRLLETVDLSVHNRFPDHPVHRDCAAVACLGRP